MLFTHDKAKLREYFRNDMVLFAYHLGDLDEFYFPDCLWAVTFDQRSKIDNTLLTYFGYETPTLLAFGRQESFAELLADYLPIAPRKFYCHYQREHRDILKRFANETPLGTHLKMYLDSDRFAAPASASQAKIARLTTGDEQALRALYDTAYPDNYFVPRMLQTGKYFAAYDGQLVAVAGVHVASDKDKIAVLGNITTHPDCRGRGLATALTAHLCSELLDEGKSVCLNVKADNTPAIACYRKLGLEVACEYEEGLFELKQAGRLPRHPARPSVEQAPRNDSDDTD